MSTEYGPKDTEIVVRGGISGYKSEGLPWRGTK